MKRRNLLGMLTPSSNTSLEPLTSAMVAGCRASRRTSRAFRVTEISLARPGAAASSTKRRSCEAAELLADAKVDVIALERDVVGLARLRCRRAPVPRITEATGIPATHFRARAQRDPGAPTRMHFGLVTPYLDDVQRTIVANYAASASNCVAERHLDLQVNFSFSEVEPDEIRARWCAKSRERQAARRSRSSAPICAPRISCRGAGSETGIPIYDTIATVVWKSLQLAEYDTRRVNGWGRLFQRSQLKEQAMHNDLDFVIRQCARRHRVATASTADIGIRDGRIAQLGLGLPKGAREIDASGMLVLPGGVDAHCHLDQPMPDGLRMADDFLHRHALGALRRHDHGDSVCRAGEGPVAARGGGRLSSPRRRPRAHRLRLSPDRHRSHAARARRGAAGADRRAATRRSRST